MKVVINDCYGGFSLSEEAKARYCKETGQDPMKLWRADIPRDSPVLIRIVEEMGRAADGAYAALKVIEIPDGVEWQIDEYDGQEWVAERHRTWS